MQTADKQGSRNSREQSYAIILNSTDFQ